MHYKTRREFLRTASILSLTILASRDVLANIETGNKSILIGRLNNLVTHSYRGSVTQWLSELFGVPVTSSIDAFGNWSISVNGGANVPLTFSLNEVQITATGRVISTISADEIYGGSGSWAPPHIEDLFNTGGASLGAIVSPPSLPDATLSKVTEGSDGISIREIIGLINTSTGMAVSHSSIAANVLKLESATSFRTINRLFAGMDIFGNIVEIRYDEQSALEMWEDVAEIVLCFALLFPVSTPIAIGGSILLTTWELWEYKRTQ